MTDLHLWNELREGQKTALEAIYREHAAALLKYGQKFTPDGQLVEDCIQELFIELWKNYAGLSATDSIRKYLLVALRRKIIREIGKKTKYLSSDEPQAYQFEATLAVDHNIIAAEVSQSEREQLKQALDQLSSKQKEIIYLKYFNGIDNQGISEILDINYQSVRNALSRALKALRHQLGSLLIIFLNILG